ncbi:MAG: chemotaxis protein CheW [Verrucomicrobiota bacterium]
MTPSHSTPDNRSNARAAKAPIDWAAVHALVEHSIAGTARHDTAMRDRELLAQRARVLAKRTRAAAAEEKTIEVVAFELDGQVFGLDAAVVREAVIPRDITALPGVPAFVRGLVNVRSRVVPAFDLRPLLRLVGRADAASEKMLIVACDGVDFGVMTERVLGLRTVAPARLRREVAGLDIKHIRGIAEDGLILLDLPALMPDLQIDDTAEL